MNIKQDMETYIHIYDLSALTRPTLARHQELPQSFYYLFKMFVSSIRGRAKNCNYQESYYLEIT